MNMNQIESTHLKVGIFVILSLALLVAAMTLLGVDAFFKETFTVETYINESVQGLDIGAPVKYRGVRIGTVGDIGFVTSRYILPNETEPLPAGSR